MWVSSLRRGGDRVTRVGQAAHVSLRCDASTGLGRRALLQLRLLRRELRQHGLGATIPTWRRELVGLLARSRFHALRLLCMDCNC